MTLFSPLHISGRTDSGKRISSRVLESEIQSAVQRGFREIEIQAYGQQGLGGRLWAETDDPIHLRIEGPTGQRLGSMGTENTTIDVMGPASDDLGWLNAGATIIVHSNASNGTANAMAQGKIYINGHVGARAMTMTKHNPRFAPPELWILGTAGDYFGEFMAGGISVICGAFSRQKQSILGYRPLVGMVGGMVFFRGAVPDLSESDAIEIPLTDDHWKWLQTHMETFLQAIDQSQHQSALSLRSEWHLLVATRRSQKKTPSRSMVDFKTQVWEKELGREGLVGDLVHFSREPISPIVTGALRRLQPFWANEVYTSPCEAACPSEIPVQQKWALTREGKMNDAISLSLQYTPFPATICGFLCPHLCMEACTRNVDLMSPPDISQIGKLSLSTPMPLPTPTPHPKKIAIIGGGPAGLSAAWQFYLAGHTPVIFDSENQLGGKITSAIPYSRISEDIFFSEVNRLASLLPPAKLDHPITNALFTELVRDFDAVLIATGAQVGRVFPDSGKKYFTSALDFLRASKKNEAVVGNQVVIIGAGNVGCDVATEAHRLGAQTITLIDIQEPASFGKEREEAQKIGAQFRWPCFTKKITQEGVWLETDELMLADTVIIAIGDAPNVNFLPVEIHTERGYICVDEKYQTSLENVFAIGDVVKPGLLTDAIGAGKKVVQALLSSWGDQELPLPKPPTIPIDRITLSFFDIQKRNFTSAEESSVNCSSCGHCIDCGTCVAICPQEAIQRINLDKNNFLYESNDSLCIACGFCSAGCPCGIWEMKENPVS